MRENPSAALKALDFQDSQDDAKALLPDSLPESHTLPRECELLSNEEITVKYFIERKIGQGAFGEVHIGHDNLTNRRVRTYISSNRVTNLLSNPGSDKINESNPKEQRTFANGNSCAKNFFTPQCGAVCECAQTCRVYLGSP